MSSQKWMISLVKQGKYKVVPADGLGRLLLTAFYKFIKRGSMAMSAGANPVYFPPILSSCMHKCILLLVLRFLWLTRTLQSHKLSSVAMTSIVKLLFLNGRCKVVPTFFK
jgi:endo-1,4-beta-D-glucanase Y